MLTVIADPTPIRAPRSVRREDVDERDWLSWRWQLRNMLTTTDELAGVIELSAAERAGLAASAHLFRVGLTPYYASLMDRRDPTCPIRMQAIPRLVSSQRRLPRTIMKCQQQRRYHRPDGPAGFRQHQRTPFMAGADPDPSPDPDPACDNRRRPVSDRITAG